MSYPQRRFDAEFQGGRLAVGNDLLDKQKFYMSRHEGWRPEGPEDKKVVIGKFDEKGVTIEPVSEEEMREIHHEIAETMLQSSVERGGWGKDWDDETRREFVDTYTALMTGVYKVARKFPEGTPSAILEIANWGPEASVAWVLIDPPSGLGARPAVRIKE